MNKIYLTGDIHGDIVPRFSFRQHKNLSGLDSSDAMFVLGDVGICWPGYEKENIYALDRMAEKPWTFFLIRGNHDNTKVWRQLTNMSVKDNSAQNWNNHIWKNSGCDFTCESGDVYRLTYMGKDYSNIFLIPDTAILQVCGKRILCIGGAKSHDIDIILDPDAPDFKSRKRHLKKTGRWFRVLNESWWPDEDVDVDCAETVLYGHDDQRFDYILTHDAPSIMCKMYSREGPRLAATFAESYLESLRLTLDYGSWVHGHMHAEWFSYGESRKLVGAPDDFTWKYEDISQHKNVCIYHNIYSASDVDDRLAQERSDMFSR